MLPFTPTPRIVRGARILTAEGIRAAAIHIEDGRITRVAHVDDIATGELMLDAGELVVLPGMVDTHVHINEPGRTEWEGFASATRAAAAGGVTTLIDMPLNSIPATTTVHALHVKANAALGKTWVDVGFLGGVVPGNTDALRKLFDAGVLGFKCFLVPSGVPEFAHVGESDLRAAMPVIAALGEVLMVHAEDPAVIAASSGALSGSDPRSYQAYVQSRPVAAELQAVALVARLAEWSGARAHIVHVSSAETVALLRESRWRGVHITAETCPHYLTFHAGAIPDGATEYKCAPPIRHGADRRALWEALQQRDLDMVVSDHSPCPPNLKELESGDFAAAWGGIASLQLGPSVVWSGMRERGVPLESLASWMSEAPARLVMLGEIKGRIDPGLDADLVLFDPDAEWEVKPDTLLHRHAITPYSGRRLAGSVEATYVRGMLAFDRVNGPVDAPPGRLLLAPRGSRDSLGHRQSRQEQ